MYSLRMFINEHGGSSLERTNKLLCYFYAKAVEWNNMSIIKPSILQE